MHARLRNKCSSLNSDLFKSKLVPSASCSCGYKNDVPTIFYYIVINSLYLEIFFQAYLDLEKQWIFLTDYHTNLSDTNFMNVN
jgi:hypothetical protein